MPSPADKIAALRETIRERKRLGRADERWHAWNGDGQRGEHRGIGVDGGHGMAVPHYLSRQSPRSRADVDNRTGDAVEKPCHSVGRIGRPTVLIVASGLAKPPPKRHVNPLLDGAFQGRSRARQPQSRRLPMTTIALCQRRCARGCPPAGLRSRRSPPGS